MLIMEDLVSYCFLSRQRKHSPTSDTIMYVLRLRLVKVEHCSTVNSIVSHRQYLRRSDDVSLVKVMLMESRVTTMGCNPSG